MSETPDRDELGGLARSIDALFANAQERRPSADPGPSPDDGMLHPAVRLVAELGQEREDDLRRELVAQLARMGNPAVDALASALANTDDRFARKVFLEAMIGLAPMSLPVVEEMMRDPRWFVVRNGAHILGELGGARSVELLMGPLASPEAKVRREAVFALAKIGGDDAAQLVFGLLDDPAATVRAAAVSAVGVLGVRRAVKPLMQLLEDEDDPDILLAALHGLGHLEDPAAVHAIEHHAVGSFLRRPPPDLRIAAYQALYRIGTPHARRILNRGVDDRDPEVKAEVRRLLGMARP